MKKRGVWLIVLAVVAVVVLLGAIGFGVLAMRMWGGRYGEMGMMHGDYGRVQDGYGADMPCEDEEGGAVCTESMPFGSSPMSRTWMPYQRGMWGMHSGWGRHGSSFLTNLLLVTLIVVGLLNLGRGRRHHMLMHKGPMHMHSGQHSAGGDGSCCSDAHGDGGVTPDSGENQPNNV